MPTHFLFVSTVLGPTIGGTETLIARMSRWLIGNGHRVTLFANAAHLFADIFDPDMTLVEAPRELADLRYVHRCRTVWPRLGIAHPDVIKSFDLQASWIGSVVGSQLDPTPRLVFGNYYPRIAPQTRNPLKDSARRLFLLNLLRTHPDAAILCMTREQISEFQRAFGRHRTPQFWPLPIEGPRTSARPRTPQWGHIVSIGRLAPMKEYNLYMVDVVANLRRSGQPVRWTVFGEGPYRKAMEQRISDLGLQEAIRLAGPLPYAELGEALKDAYAFVGMGTAAIEAAMWGVPGPVALASDTVGRTYGPLHRHPFGSCGEVLQTPPDTTVEAELKRLLSLSPEDYSREVTATRNYAAQYDMESTMRRFLEITRSVAPPRTSRMLLAFYYLHGATEPFRRMVSRRTA